ncbi:small-conductance mechanosensitive channel [Geomicrobium sp. JSM 1781026]|uniref:small-conductance mechanosensitive channel n=1 Tax=Geomicrobium sp. JSM 1781026 TaxID=3344580 RepID=UPI0035C015B5
MKVFHSRSHFWGRVTLLSMIIATFLAPFYLSFVVGAHPGWDVIIAGIIGYASFIGIMWALEPITYYPTLGVSGTYLAFMQGNIANLCLPCSTAAQSAVNAETGSDKAEIAGTIGIAVACLVNMFIIATTVITGSFLISILPPAVETAFLCVLPAIFGAVLGQFAYKRPLYGLLALIIGVIVYYLPIFDLLNILISVLVTVFFVIYLEKRKDKRANDSSLQI